MSNIIKQLLRTSIEFMRNVKSCINLTCELNKDIKPNEYVDNYRNNVHYLYHLVRAFDEYMIFEAPTEVVNSVNNILKGNTLKQFILNEYNIDIDDMVKLKDKYFIQHIIENKIVVFIKSLMFGIDTLKMSVIRTNSIIACELEENILKYRTYSSPSNNNNF